jgi:hypothetical protein
LSRRTAEGCKRDEAQCAYSSNVLSSNHPHFPSSLRSVCCPCLDPCAALHAPPHVCKQTASRWLDSRGRSVHTKHQGWMGGGEDISCRCRSMPSSPALAIKHLQPATDRFHFDADEELAMCGVSLHHPSVYLSQPSWPSIPLPSLTRLRPWLPSKLPISPPHCSPWSTSTQPTPPPKLPA